MFKNKKPRLHQKSELKWILY